VIAGHTHRNGVNGEVRQCRLWPPGALLPRQNKQPPKRQQHRPIRPGRIGASHRRRIGCQEPLAALSPQRVQKGPKARPHGPAHHRVFAAHHMDIFRHPHLKFCDTRAEQRVIGFRRQNGRRAFYALQYLTTPDSSETLRGGSAARWQKARRYRQASHYRRGSHHRPCHR
jgi:hypothetical protein